MTKPFPFTLMDRYLISEMIQPLLFGIGAFSSITLAIGSLFELIRLITDAGLNILIALQVFALQLPGFMVYSFPMSVLLATLLTYSRFSADGETIALRSCGVGVYRLIAPALILSIITTGATFVFNEVIVPSANYQAKSTLKAALKQDNPQFKTRNISFQQYGDVEYADGRVENELIRLFLAKRFDGQQMLDVTVIDNSQGHIQQILKAKSAVWLPSANMWEFRQGTNYVINASGTYRSILKFDQQSLHLPRAPLDFAQEQRNAEEMNISQLTRYTNLVRQSGNFKEVKKLEVRLQQKYALPFICVVFALVGAPLGMRPQRTSTARGFGVSVLIIFGYYLLLFVCGALGQVEILSPLLAAWMPNLICFGAGLFLTSRVV
ncbi:MAG: LptF/LptG family permease [Pseudanabaenaceae cyanobacterium bins.68]|nr:LptF/LptG family permease [Pseudanabaenaceae cyanobacterium bins.68]